MDRIANPSDQVQSRRRGPDSKNRIETDLATEQTVAQKVGPRSTQSLQSSEFKTQWFVLAVMPSKY